MIVSYSHDFIFIHVGKTAGTNIGRCLAPYAHKPERYLINRLLSRVGINANYLPPLRWKRFRVHATALTARRHLPRAFYDNAFKFAFVRNPWDWILSQYNWVLRTPSHHRHAFVKSLGSFERYLEWEMRRNRRDQQSFVTDGKGNVIVDFIGRFEHLYEDFGRALERIGIDAEIPRDDVTPRRDYREHYTDATREAVARHFATDIRLFGYTFEGAITRDVELARNA